MSVLVGLVVLVFCSYGILGQQANYSRETCFLDNVTLVYLESARNATPPTPANYSWEYPPSRPSGSAGLVRLTKRLSILRRFVAQMQFFENHDFGSGIDVDVDLLRDNANRSLNALHNFMEQLDGCPLMTGIITELKNDTTEPILEQRNDAPIQFWKHWKDFFKDTLAEAKQFEGYASVGNPCPNSELCLA
ncbi:uncharacterized protein [Diadema antillarum]|uniref:uncharacterized protein n=1 Tax=Diadema antillarum TaxID=105358 RepID=UPI003A89198A